VVRVVAQSSDDPCISLWNVGASLSDETV
jgi:hypothetical protein